MILVLSPSKTLDFESAPQTSVFTEPPLLDHAETLISDLRGYDSDAVRDLMKVSEKIADLNVERYQSFETPFTPANAKQALLAFKGDVYRDFALDQYDERDFDFAQQHIRILSGLYGVLKPMDLMQPYRLEMGTKLKTARGKNLYEFWGAEIAAQLRQSLDEGGDNSLLNLASMEYFKSIDKKTLQADIVDVAFLENKKGNYKIVSFFAKRARGTMANWIVQERVNTPSDVKAFAEDGYYFSKDRSTDTQLVFLRDGKDAA